MRPPFNAGVRTNNQPTAGTISWRSPLLTSSRRSSTRPAAGRLSIARSGTRRRDPWGLADLLSVVWRPWRIPDALAFVARRRVEESVDRPGAGVDPGVAIADLREPLDHRREREVFRLTDVELFPRDGSRHTRVGGRPH